MNKFLCICLSPTIQKTVSFDYFNIGCVNRTEKHRLDASGKAINSARVLNQLSKNSAKIISPVGLSNKSLFLNLAERDNLDIICIDSPGYTRECWTVLDNYNKSTTELIADECTDSFDFSKVQNELIGQIEFNIKNIDGVILAGSCPKYFSEALPSLIAKIAIDSNKFFLADYCGKNLLNTLSICTPNIIKINEEEFLKTFEYDNFIKENDLIRLITEKSKEFCNIFIITRGKKSTFAANNGFFVEFPSENIKPINTTACGDSFSAGFLHEYLLSNNFEEALAKGTWCAARNAESIIPGSIRKN